MQRAVGWSTQGQGRTDEAGRWVWGRARGLGSLRKGSLDYIPDEVPSYFNENYFLKTSIRIE